MKAEELRLGNFVLDMAEYRECQMALDDFACIGNYARSGRHPIPYSPIPISPEWLERLGFVYHEAGHPMLDTDRLVFNCGAFEVAYEFDAQLFFIKTLFGDSSILIDKKPEYVHQIQNLIFALTGTELNIKP